MKHGPQIALAVAVGYALGRSKKMKLAITVGGMMAGRRLAGEPQRLLEEGVKVVGSSPEVSKLKGELRDRLVEAAKNAAMAAATNKIDSLGENLTRRVSGMDTPSEKVSSFAKSSDEQDERSDTGPEEDRAASEEHEEPRRRARPTSGGREPPAKAETSRQRASSSAREARPPRARSGDQGTSRNKPSGSATNPARSKSEHGTPGKVSRSPSRPSPPSRPKSPPRSKRGEENG